MATYTLTHTYYSHYSSRSSLVTWEYVYPHLESNGIESYNNQFQTSNHSIYSNAGFSTSSPYYTNKNSHDTYNAIAQRILVTPSTGQKITSITITPTVQLRNASTSDGKGKSCKFTPYMIPQSIYATPTANATNQNTGISAYPIDRRPDTNTFLSGTASFTLPSALYTNSRPSVTLTLTNPITTQTAITVIYAFTYSVIFKPNQTVLTFAETANSYSVSYNNNGGTGSITAQSGTYGSSITLSDGSGMSKANTDSNVTITITYNANGGSGAPGNSTGTAVNTTPYTLSQWALNSASGTKYNKSASFTIPAGNSTMYAVWAAGTTTRKSNPSITLSSTIPTRTGYTFLGWSTSNTATSASYTKGTAYTFSSNTTLYAVWQENGYYINYDLQGGSFATAYDTVAVGSGTWWFVYNPKTTKVPYEHGPAAAQAKGTTAPGTSGANDYILVQNPTKNGYTFTGWTISNHNTSTATVWTTSGVLVSTLTNGSIKQQNFCKLTPTDGATVKFTANWSPNPYTLTINPNGGSYNGSTSNTTVTQNCDTTYNLLQPTRTGYNFCGWSKTGTGTFKPLNYSSTSCSYQYVADSTYGDYARFTYNQPVDTASHWYSVLTAPFAFTAGHKYTLSGWVRCNSYAGTGAAIRFSRVDNDYYTGVQSFSVTAQNGKGWVYFSLTQTLNATTDCNGTTKTTSPRFEFYTSNTANLACSGSFDFKALQVKDETTGTMVTPYSTFTYGAGAGTLTAKWSANTYTITFAGNGATSGVPAAITRTYGESVTFPSTAPTRTGYVFKGWIYGGVGSDSNMTNSTATSGYAAGRVVLPTESSTNICWNASNTTYVAVWEAAPLTFADKTNSTAYDYSNSKTYTIPAATGGTASDAYTYAVDGTPTSGLTFNVNTRVVTLAANKSPGNYIIKVKATDKNSGATKIMTLTWTVTKANLTVTATSERNYNGSAQYPAIAVTSSGWDGKTIVAGTSTSYGTTIQSNGMSNTPYNLTVVSGTNVKDSKTNPGTYGPAYYKITGGTNYNDYTGSVGLKINPVSQAAPSTVSGQVASFHSTATATASGGGGYGTLTWKVTSGSNDSGNINQRTAIGTHKVKAYWAGDNNHYASPDSSEVTLTITTAPDAGVTITTTGRTYNGTAQTLATWDNPHGISAGGMQATATSITTAPTSGWSTSAITKTAAGTYRIWYYWTADSNHSGSNQTATYTDVTISKKEVGLTWGTLSWMCDGNTHSTTCTATGLISGDSCTVTLSGNSVGPNVGTSTVTATGLSNSNYKLPTSNLSKTLEITGGIVRIKVGNEWKTALPYVFVNGAWKQALPYVFNSGNWKIGV